MIVSNFMFFPALTSSQVFSYILSSIKVFTDFSTEKSTAYLYRLIGVKYT